MPSSVELRITLRNQKNNRWRCYNVSVTELILSTMKEYVAQNKKLIQKYDALMSEEEL